MTTHDSTGLWTLEGGVVLDQPSVSSVLRDGNGVEVARLVPGNLIGGIETGGLERVVISPGWLAAEDDEPASPADPSVSFRTFTQEGRGRYEAALDQLVERAGQTRFVLRPTAASFLSDIPSVRAEARRWGGDARFASLGLLVDPAALFTPEMLTNAEDHLRRMTEGLLGVERVWAVLVTDVTPVGPGPEVRLGACPVGEGSLAIEALRAFARAAAGLGLPIAVLAEDAAGQARRLGIV